MKEIHKIKLHYWELIEELLKEQRHDFLNEIQIIYGYMKLNRTDKVIEYINKCSKNAKINSKLSNLNCIELYIMLSDKFKRANNLGLCIDFEVYSVGEKKDIVVKNLDDAVFSFEKIVDIILHCMYTNSHFEEQIFYIEEMPDAFILKIEIDDSNLMDIMRKELENFKDKVIFEDNYLIYEVELD
ncbi:Spo0B domain-containing protein [Alkalithermobacter paradoxus]|uniref:SpoOB alpha-helical domain-containing protein n=1 Tax=Alkalithermobacter paradoxus TaxID=29349 RepID=A0A1V4I7N3_9FIRM|nr:hypothetical protein CLOTH_13150 [[Clostridium] thermoalcaliphilum]